ncbi:MAG: hypothetical protein IKA02_04525 [Clostridia bacterium]|nr:hypothetical protein [Clostridia bacterium]
MSIVIAYKKGDTVYMGADTKRSQGEFTTTIESKNEMKINKIGNEMLIGSVGAVANIQTMLDNREMWFNTKGKQLTKKFIVENVIPKFFIALKNEGKMKVEKGKSPIANSCFCVTDGKKIYLINDNFTVTEINDFCAIGCTCDIAYAYLRNAKSDKEPNDIILSALRGSVYRHDGVGAPYLFIDTEKFEYTDVEK